MPVSSPQKHILSPSDLAIISQALFLSNSNVIVYTKYKEIRVGHKGKYRVKFDLTASSATYTVYGRIYKNGTAFGTERSTSIITYTTFTEDLDFDIGDLLQLYCKSSSASYYVGWKNLIIYGDLGPAFVNLDT